MRPYRDIATLAGVQVFCFLLLSHLEPDFFLIHFYQTTIYLALLILLFYMEDRWAYMIGMLAPAVWLAMAFATGMLGGAVRQIFRIGEGAGMTNVISLIAGATALLSLLMIAACGRHWFREYSGLGKSLSTFTVSLGVVGIYYAVLVVWFWHLIPVAAAGKTLISARRAWGLFSGLRWRGFGAEGGPRPKKICRNSSEVLAYWKGEVYFSTAQLLF